MDATTVGLDANSIVLGKHSGRHALKQALEELGFTVVGPGAQPGVQALQGAGRQEEAGHGDGPRGARHRRARATTATASRSSGSTSRPPRAGRRTPPWASARPRGRSCRARSPATARSTPIFRAINAATGIEDARLREFRVDAVTGRPGRPRRDLGGARGGRPSRPRARASRPTSSRRPGGPTCARSATPSARRPPRPRPPPRRSSRRRRDRRAGGATADRPARLAAPRRRGDRRARDAARAARRRAAGPQPAREPRASGGRASDGSARPRRPRGARATSSRWAATWPPCWRASPWRWCVGPSPHDGHHGHEPVGRAVRDALEAAGDARAPLVDVGPVGGPAPSHPVRALRGAPHGAGARRVGGLRRRARPQRLRAAGAGTGGGQRGPGLRARLRLRRRRGQSRALRRAGVRAGVARRALARGRAPSCSTPPSPWRRWGTAWTWTGGCARRASASACAPRTPARPSPAPHRRGPAGSPPPGPRPRTRGP